MVLAFLAFAPACGGGNEDRGELRSIVPSPPSSPEAQSAPVPRSPEGQVALVTHDDGTVSVYSGPSIVAQLATGTFDEDRAELDFVRMRVPLTLLDQMNSRVDLKVVTIALDQPRDDVELLIRTRILPGSVTPGSSPDSSWHSLRIRPGDPWTTGYAQLRASTFDGAEFVLMGYQVEQWHRFAGPSGSPAFSVSYFGNGITDDPQLPARRYTGPASRWTNVPPSWLQ